MEPSQPRLSPVPGLIGELVAPGGSGRLLTKNVVPHGLVVFLSACCLVWPALWNGYPIVFADTGTYLSQAMHRYLSWDRPVFYSFFIWPLHLGLTTWPVILVQSFLAVFVLDLTRRGFGLAGGWLLALTAFLSVATWLPWTVSELMPDLFTPLLILLLGRLVFLGSELCLHDRIGTTLLAAFMIGTQQSSVPLAIGLLIIVIPVRWLAGSTVLRPGRRRDPLSVALAPLLAPCVAIVALVLVNWIGLGRISVSPYGNVFILARVIYDGPGMAVLRRECPGRGWRLCPYLDRLPATADEFLWDASSPVMLAGGHKAISADADAIIREAVLSEPGQLLVATWNNTIEQLTRFASGDGLERWDAQVAPWIDQDFPAAEREAFHAGRQQSGLLALPMRWGSVHRVIALAGIAAALGLLPFAWHRRHVAAWFLGLALLALPLSAAVTGGLSTPHDRYQSRIVWLPAAMAVLTVAALRSHRRRSVR